MKWLDEKIRTSIYNPRDKARVQETHVRYMLARTQRMFRYTGLPDTIPERMVELYLQTNGHLCFAEWNNDLYVYIGGLGGEPDVYYRPTLYTVANPAQKWSRSLVIDSDCVVMSNDSLYLGLLPLFHRYAYNLAENEVSLLVADINSRIVSLISGGDDRTLASARQFLADIETGKLGVIAENAFLDGIRAQPFSSTGSMRELQELIEYEQYLKASWYNELGLDSNYNMKRERLSTAESDMNQDCLLPLADDMLHCREVALEKVNALFGTSISVTLDSAWEDNAQQREIVTDMLLEGLESDEMVNDTDMERGEVSDREKTV